MIERECIVRPGRFLGALVAVVLVTQIAAGQGFVPGQVPLNPSVRRVVDDRLNSDADRQRLRLFHGLYDELDDATKRTATYKLATFQVDDPVFFDAATEPYLRAAAAYERGDLHEVDGLLGADRSARAQVLRGRACIGLGQWARAVEALGPVREAARNGQYTGAADMVAAVEAIVELAQLEGLGSGEYQFVMDTLGESREADRYYWPRMVVEGALMAEKDNPQEAVEALHGALTYNAAASGAWDELGRLALRTFDFSGGSTAVLKLRQINPHHPYADALEVESLLKQKDVAAAEAALAEGLSRWPNNRRLMAATAALAALKHDDAGVEGAMKQFDAVSPKHPLAYYVMGSHLSFARQYPEAEAALTEAVRRQPNWTAPQIELGLLLNQYGKDEAGILVLRRVTQVDPYNKRALNVLKMLEDLVGYHSIETDHFLIRWREPIDEALAGDMAPMLERYYREVGDVYGHHPAPKTLIDIMPTKEYFAVRITGMPDIWTIGAATGPIVAITPPRIGKKQAGEFDWQRVMRHEYTHTVTLSATNNRIPHWFTEACAVSQEPNPRDFGTYQMLADAYLGGELFDLDSINWAFVRPKKPNDRAMAYAQAHWMYQYITATYGHAAILKILDLSRQGVPLPAIVPTAVGKSAEQFMSEFRQWAGDEVKAWGLSPDPPTDAIVKQVTEAGDRLSRVAKLLELRQQHPEHPDVLKMLAAAAMEDKDDATALDLLRRYAKARPVDPWADGELADLALRQGRKQDAIPHLAVLDSLDQKTGYYAEQLTAMHEELGQLDEAQHAAMLALARQPYSADRRESAARIALKRGDTELARHHVRALTLIEPDRWVHFARLAAVESKLGHVDAAHDAAVKAKQLNAEAPVDKFLK